MTAAFTYDERVCPPDADDQPAAWSGPSTARPGPRPALRISFLADAPSVLNQRWFRYAVGRGDDVHVVTLDPAPVAIPGVTEHVVGRWLPAALPRSLRMAAAAPQVRALVRRLHPDLVHSHYAWGFGIWGAATGVHPFVVSAWGTDVMGSANGSWLRRTVLRWVFDRADMICATGEQLAQVTRRFSDDEVVVTPFGVDTSAFSPAEPADDEATDSDAEPAVTPLRLGMVKRLDDNSGIGILLQALADPAAPPGATLEVIGAATDDGWQTLARDLGLADRVTFRGALPPTQVARAIRTWDLAVQPSRWVEGFGVSALEASASGVPVVASRLGGLQEVVQDGVTGRLVTPNDPVALATVLAELAAAPHERRAMGAAGRSWVVGRYDEQTAEETMDRVYHAALEGHA